MTSRRLMRSLALGFLLAAVSAWSPPAFAHCNDAQYELSNLRFTRHSSGPRHWAVRFRWDRPTCLTNLTKFELQRGAPNNSESLFTSFDFRGDPEILRNPPTGDRVESLDDKFTWELGSGSGDIHENTLYQFKLVLEYSAPTDKNTTLTTIVRLGPNYPPINPSVSQSEGTVRVEWRESPKEHEAPVDGYYIERRQGTTGDYVRVGEAGKDARSWEGEALGEGAFWYRVRGWSQLRVKITHPLGPSYILEGVPSTGVEIELSTPVPGPDVNDDDAIDASDALILYYAYALRNDLGTGRDNFVSYQSGAPSGALFQGCGACPEMVVVSGGTFQMGSTDADATFLDETPQHEVTIPRFAVGRYEVTFDEWDVCHAAGGCSHDAAGDEDWGRGNRPVIDVSWNDAKEYVAWLSQRTGDTYRLLSESEWEYVARAGSTMVQPWQDLRSGNAHCSDCGGTLPTGQTAPVGSYAANAFGLYDMRGNVREWVEDCWNNRYTGAPDDGTAWVSGNCNQRVNRGGDWNSSAGTIHPALRLRGDLDARLDKRGFRVARDLD